MSDQAEILRRAAEAAANVNRLLGVVPGAPAPALLSDTAHDPSSSAPDAAPLDPSNPAAQSLAVLQKYQQDFMTLKQEEQRQKEEQRLAAQSREPHYIPRPFSPPREDTSFGPDRQKDMDIRRMRSRCLLNRHDHINKMLASNQLPIPSERFRSPSPPPVYDPENGQRLNTREQRTKDMLDLERRDCLGEAVRINSEIKVRATHSACLFTSLLSSVLVCL